MKIEEVRNDPALQFEAPIEWAIVDKDTNEIIALFCYKHDAEKSMEVMYTNYLDIVKLVNVRIVK